MAKEKTTDVIQETEAVKPTEAVEPKEELVEVELFKDNKDYKDDVFVCVNGKNRVIKRGEKVKVPKAFAEVLDNSKKQDAAASKLMEQKADEFSAETRARNI